VILVVELVGYVQLVILEVQVYLVMLVELVTELYR
jgi:hypothetical protein